MIDRDTIIRMAREVGAVSEVIAMGRHSGILFTQLELEHFAALIAALVSAAERERCIEACEASYHLINGPEGWLKYAVEAIKGCATSTTQPADRNNDYATPT